MTDEINSLSYRRHHDVEAGISRSDDDDDNPFYITRTKHAPIKRLRRWRQAALLLNASRQFRYTLYLKKDKEKQQKLRKIRVHAQATRAEEARQQLIGPTGEFSIGQEQLSSMTRNSDITVLQQYEGVKGLSVLLKTNLDKGISGDDVDIRKRRNAFGSNAYPQKKGRSFWTFLWEAWQDLTLIILMVAAVASLALGIKTEGIKEGWYDGGSIAFAVILVIVVTAISESLLFQNFNDETRKIHLEVIRGDRRVEVSIYDLVVGDVVPLNIGDQVPADGVVISGHSLSIDESIMTGESKIVHKDSRNPFLMSGCKVADGSGTMLVTGVGGNTEWGLHMANISVDTGEETPLQVRLNRVATFIGIVGLAVAFIVSVVLLARFFTGRTKNPDGSVPFTPGKTKVGDAVDGAIKILTVAVTIVVVAVPEGLPLVVTLTLAYSMRKMMADKALVRRLSACEKMGLATTICWVKTGTLTLNQDTCRPGVKDAVRECRDACVKVRMVTGDNIQTARDFALNCGILTSEEEASESIIDGKTFRELRDSEREERAEKILVMGESSPDDKLLLVKALRKRGHVVAVTVDNDALTVDNDGPALNETVIRLAMGIQGTKVAKESSDIIILDGSFASVVKVVRWGRSVYANIQKFIQFQLTVNVAALVITFVAAFCSGDVPLNVVQLLWVNLIMDTLGALALATEPPTDHQMQRPQVVQREPLIINITWGDRLMQAIYHLCVLLVLNFNVVALVIYIVSVVSSGDYPLNGKQTLLVTLIINFLGSLTMAIERHIHHQLHRPPVGRRDNHVVVQSCLYSREPLITNIMWRNLLIQAIYQSGVLLVLNFRGKSLLNLEHDTSDYANKVKNTLIFNSFVICQIFNEFNARKPDERNIFTGITKNHLFMGIVALTVVLQILIIEFLGKFTSTVRLNWKQWIISVVIGFIGWPLAFIGKFISVPATPLSSIFKSNMQTG